MGCCNVYGSVTTLTVLFPVVPLEWGPIITLQYSLRILYSVSVLWYITYRLMAVS